MIPPNTDLTMRPDYAKGYSMNIYKISQDENGGYDTYDSAVVCAPSEAIARRINPVNGELLADEDWLDWFNKTTWGSSSKSIKVELLGKAKRGIKQGVITASFNA